jgi:hypothetical protein
MATRRKRSTSQSLSEYAAENKRRQSEWEPGFRQRIEAVIAQLGGPGKVQAATRIKSQTLQKIRRGGSRLALFAVFCDATGVNPTWLLLGAMSEPRYRRGAVGINVEDEVARIVASQAASARSKSVDGADAKQRAKK